mmetsp:Transcript_26166/g.57256  ORF Transcript_26166/g.57256 Transcript_26166/m.57256 type:complete len:236 (+) Transcript_26166:1998-2705(+)
MMICRLFRDVTHELSHLDVVAQALFEGAEEHLSLRWLEAIHQGWNRPLHIVLGKLNQLLIDELGIGDGLGMIHHRAIFIAVDPILPVVCTFLVEGQIDGLAILVAVPLELHFVLLDLAEILLGLFGSAGPQTFVILDLPAFATIHALLPGLVVVKGEEALFVLSIVRLLSFLPDLDNGRDEFLQEPRHLGQRWPPKVNQVDQQTLDMRSVVILIRHQHNGSIAQTLSTVVLAFQV